jgi:hypothetical protein
MPAQGGRIGKTKQRRHRISNKKSCQHKTTGFLRY